MLFLFVQAKVASEQASVSDARRTNCNRVTEAKLAIAERNEGRAYAARRVPTAPTKQKTSRKGRLFISQMMLSQ